MESGEEIRWLGCDCGEQHHALTLLTASGQVDQTWEEVSNRPAVLEKILRQVDRRIGDARLRVVVEMRGGCGRVLYRTAVALGLEVWEVPPRALKSFRDSEGQPRKDDSLDAFLLARMGFVGSGRCRLLADPRPEEQRLCRVTRLHRQVTEQKTQATNRLRSRLLELHPELVRKGAETPRWQSQRMLDVLAVFPALVGLEEAETSDLESLLCTVGVRQRQREARALEHLAAELQVSPEEQEILELEIRMLVAEIRRLGRGCKELEQRIRSYIQDHPLGPKLLQMPGIGPITAGVLIGELLPLARHVSEGKVATYAGVTPLSRRSGQSSGRSRIARGTNKHVLRVLYQSAMSAARVSALDRAYYRKKKAGYSGHPNPHAAAILALTRQRVKLMYKLLTTEERYDKEVLISSHMDRQHSKAA